MSTMTSSDMCVKRSTTRVHAPPGGSTSWSLGGDYGGGNTHVKQPMRKMPTSSLSFGNDGLGAAAAVPTTSADYDARCEDSTPTPSSSNTAVVVAPSSKPPHVQYNNAPSVNNNQSSQDWNASRAAPAPLATQMNITTQPPLTSSKRDQNWAKKRQRFLQRKAAGGMPTGRVSPQQQVQPVSCVQDSALDQLVQTVGGGGSSQQASLQQQITASQCSYQQQAQTSMQNVPQSYSHQPQHSEPNYQQHPMQQQQYPQPSSYQQQQPYQQQYQQPMSTPQQYSYPPMQYQPQPGYVDPATYYPPAAAQQGGYGTNAGATTQRPNTGRSSVLAQSAAQSMGTYSQNPSSTRQPPGGSTSWSMSG